ncbi:hypothetical protein COW36_05535 [bacterium (Candidatus Blackallbacteria) CG17_big_fil_post_rev_8_21_14_2_50_48_46]|uniref:DUF962 domain-containing protein n=1 Tax=bacterium (Candidatus Blackallbacteria) CG17_big_fil_post_rev_8_21_14_2_50_48_46 TaxID=2014261 RepID=A0A2M7G818_9BACT|nr:MAG: hypothetical protein COW64_21130 [bacterium (Candidatus Blackallbacteria) CG18_big_fil_WC_8_21_14_2_50_49_26]PIW18230.1 MAG: hypothetical protein COW36_05535 [bacterium (Candidatus Blackallbacteria) CG17_big_fil_post_rev_8_21_14_2_50_48_46]PIW50661.1 MAG: hypothetical protein COW20_01800 [bacterium (Candidatus Blackallbacteria) CG13_big_fil_rev_8_21_14_2_50_49_14]
MKATTSRAFRQKHINTYSYADFDNFEDYFLYLHLNQDVLRMHFFGSFVSIPLLPWALWMSCYQHQFWPLVLYLGLYYGCGFSSHFLCDGRVSKTTPDYGPSYFYVINLNFRILAGKMKEYERNYFEKYPHTLWVYDKNLEPPAGVIGGGR